MNEWLNDRMNERMNGWMNERVTRPNQSIKSAVAGLLKGKVLVGHALSNDLKVLLLSHPHTAIRDTARCETRAPLHCLALDRDHILYSARCQSAVVHP